MAYVRTVWNDDAAPPISAANLNHAEDGIYNAHVTADAALPKASSAVHTAGATISAANTDLAFGGGDAPVTSINVTTVGGTLRTIGTPTRPGQLLRIRHGAANGFITLKHNLAGTGAKLILRDAVDALMIANSVFTFVYDGTNWVELSRNRLPILAKARRDITVPGAQSIPNNTTTYVTLDVVDIDRYGMWSAGNPSRLTIPEWGDYRIEAQGSWAVNGTGYRELQIVVNRGISVAYMQNLPTISVNSAPHMRCQNVHSFSAGDYLEVAVLQTSGGALDFTLGDGNFYQGFTVERVG